MDNPDKAVTPTAKQGDISVRLLDKGQSEEDEDLA